MTTRKRTPGGVPAQTLTANITSGATSMQIVDGTGWPATFPYDVIVNRTSATSRERITVGGASGTTPMTLNTLTRGIDGTSGQAHSLGDSVEIAVAGSFLDELGQLLGGSAGNIYYYDGSALQKLTTGNARQRLISGTTPAWSYTSIPTYANAAARDAEIAAPAAGMAAYLDTGDSLEGLYFYNGTNWRPVSWNAPWGVVTSVTRTTNQTGISTITDVTSMSITFTRVTGRQYRLSAIASLTNGSTANAQSEVDITDNSNARVALGSAVLSATGVIPVVTVTPWMLMTGAAGSVTYKLRASVSAGTVDILGATTSPMWLIAEDIGPSGAPT